MKKIFFKPIKLLICVSFIISLLIVPVYIPVISHADTKSDYEDNNRELEYLKNEQAKLSSELSELNSQLESAGEKLNDITIKIEDKQHEIDRLNTDISSMEEDKARQYETMKLRIQYMYEKNDYNYLDLLLASKSMSELLQKAEYVQQISEYDRDMLEELSSLLTSLNENKIRLEQDIAELISLKEEAVAESNNLKRLISSKQSSIDTNQENIEQSEALALEYEEKIRKEETQKQLEQIKNSAPSWDEQINNTPISFDTTDLAMVAAMIECEAGDQSYEGKLAVGSVIINRVNSPRFGNTIQSVLYAPYQFSPVASGRFAIVLARGANSECVKAATEVLNGHITINALYFHMYDSSLDTGGTIIGDHIFY